MATIHILSDDLASQVAAGEVVERPAAAVKELIENSLDAGATQIDVAIERGGAALIRVADNGCGMDREDAQLALERHATSKLRSREDLDRITTLGFRGEAVPSIASVSKFRLMTRPAEEPIGTELVVEAGIIKEVRDYGGVAGTVIEARQLFFCVPGRRKFLRTENTEAGHVEHQVRLHAVSAPEVGFTLQRDGREQLRLPPARNLRERVHGLAGGDLASSLIEVPEVLFNETVRVSGLVAPPSRARRDKQFTLVFLNGRPIDAGQVSHALREALAGQIDRGTSPVAFLFLEMDPALVDVNVHPSKREVRFRDGRLVQHAIITAVGSALAEAAKASLVSPANPPIAPVNTTDTLDSSPTSNPRPATAHRSPSGSSITQLPESFHKAQAEPQHLQPHLEPRKTPSVPTEKDATELSEAVKATSSNSPSFRVHGVIDGGYALLEGDEGLVVLDLRAGHERVLYERMLAAAENGSAESQQLLVPEVVELGPRDFETVLDHRQDLESLGFEIEEFGTNTLRLAAVPTFLKDASNNDEPNTSGDWVVQLVTDLRDTSASTARTGSSNPSMGWRGALVARASRSAISTRASLSDREVDTLLIDLLACEMPYAAPNGRPTLIQFSRQELDRRFGRTR